MVEVFKTNVTDHHSAMLLTTILLNRFPGCLVNFDLDDCDRILRVEGQVASESVIMTLQDEGYFCAILEN